MFPGESRKTEALTCFDESLKMEVQTEPVSAMRETEKGPFLTGAREEEPTPLALRAQ